MSRQYTQTRNTVKQQVIKEYLALPKLPSGLRKMGSVAALVAKYNLRDREVITGRAGWLWQYNNGGWDSTYAVGFTRQGNASMR